MFAKAQLELFKGGGLKKNVSNVAGGTVTAGTDSWM